MSIPSPAMCQAVENRTILQPLLIGTNIKERGIFASTINLETGEFENVRDMNNQSVGGFLALHPRLPLLYIVTFEQTKPRGGVRAFSIESVGKESAIKKLSLIGKQPTGDEGATHLAVSPKADSIVVAHYGGGSTALLPLDEEGSIRPLQSLVKHTGSSINTKRQKQPHAHGVAWSKDGNFACIADLGTDEIIVYRVTDEMQLVRHSAWKAAAGAGPRHISFHPNGQWLYCLNELDSTVSVLQFDRRHGQLLESQTVGTLPSDFQEHNTTAEVVVHPNGKFIFCSNRGHDSVAAFSVDAETGHLTLLEIESTQGKHPRFIGLDPSGKFLIVANRDTNNLVSFHINADKGTLTPTGHQVAVPNPVCVVFPQTTR